MLTVNEKLITLCDKPIKTVNLLPKILITKKDLIKKRGNLKRGNFGSHNPKRLSYVYTESELKALTLFNGFSDNRFIHEYNLRCKHKGITHNYHSDFYDILTKTDIEVNPLFHESFNDVCIRDKLREKLIKNKFHVETININVDLKNLDNMKKRINEVKRYLSKKGINKEILDYYIKKKRVKR